MKGLRGGGAAWVALLFAWALMGRAEDLKLYRVGVDEGLSQATVQAFLLDRHGHLWIGTQDGLNRYDGHSFRVYRPDPTGSGSLPFTQVSALAEDASGLIWVGLASGQIAVYDPLSDRFSPAGINRLDGLNGLLFWDPQTLCVATRRGLVLARVDAAGQVKGAKPVPGTERLQVQGVTVDETGQVWLATPSGLWCVRREGADGRVQTSLRSLIRSGSREPVLTVVCADGAGSLYAGGPGGVWKVGVQSPSPFELILNRAYLGSPARALGNEGDGTLWVGTQRGLCIWNPLEGARLFRGERDQSGTPFLELEVTAIIRDSAGHVWLGSNGGGMARWHPGSRVFAHLDARGAEPALSNPLVFSILEDRLGRLWVGTLGGGLSRFADWKGGSPQRLATSEGFYGDRVTSLLEDREGEIWAGSERGLFRYSESGKRFSRVVWPREPHSQLMVTHLRQDEAGRIWVSTLNRGVLAFDPEKGGAWTHWDQDGVLYCNKVFGTFQDSRGRIWVGYQERGLDLLRPDGSRLTELDAEGRVLGLTSPTVLSFHEDSGGDVWVGTFGGGLLRAPAGGFPLESLRMAQGLPNDVVYGVLSDARGRLWLSTNNGLAVMEPGSRTIVRYSRQDGLLCNEFNLGAFHVGLHSRRLFFGGVEGLVSFDPGLLSERKPVLPVVIRKAEVLSPGAQQARIIRYPAREGAAPLVLNPRDRVLNMEVLVMNLADPQRGRCRYRLEPMETDWQILAEGDRRVTYMNLDPGTYRFRAQGSDPDGQFSGREAVLFLRVLPAFWDTVWFRALAGALLLGLGTWGYRRRLRELARRTRMHLELEAAREAQGAIMPTRGLQGPGWEVVGLCLPAFEVGGDFYDYLRFGADDQFMGLMVGDVSGKAMKAAMTALLANGMVHAGARWESSLHVLMDQLNTLLHEKTDRRVFTAMALARYQPRERILDFVSAGLPQPLLGRGGTILPLSGQGPRYPLGLLAQGGYQTTRLPLQEGDWVVWMTDGVTEAVDPAGAFFGMERLEGALRDLMTRCTRAEEMVTGLMARVRAFVGDTPLRDDLTLVVLHLPQTPAGLLVREEGG